MQLSNGFIHGVIAGALLDFFSQICTESAMPTKIASMESNQTSEHLLLQKLQAGDHAAFRECYDRYFGLILYVARRTGVDSMEAEDIVQETFLKLMRHANSVRDAGAIKSWLITSARNSALDILRRKQSHQVKAEHIRHDPANQTAELIPDSYVRELEVTLIGDLIRDIADKTGDDILVQFYIDGLSAQEIAAHHAVPISTITNRLSRARKRFREFLAGHIQNLRDSLS